MFLSTTILITILFSLTTPLLALPNRSLRTQQEGAASARQARIAAFNAQRPMHTTALLAGAAATPAANAGARDMRIRDLRTVTGESGLWVNLEDIRGQLGEVDEEDDGGEEDILGSKAERKSGEIWEREGWDKHAVEI